MGTHVKILPNGTAVSIEDNGGSFVQVHLKSGKVVRSMGVTKEELAALHMLASKVLLNWSKGGSDVD